MKSDDFLLFIKDKTGMQFNSSDLDCDLSSLDEWDSLTFMYMIITLENEIKIKFEVDKLLACRNLREIFEVMNNEISKNM
ncbi:phosphopantetheine-binding protein [Photorhabdus viridis]|uniref:phosphopantetheine-binding protein n=1 Tax=Photorhabdus viridis TaxID=3163327 RepID=UPI003307894C